MTLDFDIIRRQLAALDAALGLTAEECKRWASLDPKDNARSVREKSGLWMAARGGLAKAVFYRIAVEVDDRIPEGQQRIMLDASRRALALMDDAAASSHLNFVLEDLAAGVALEHLNLGPLPLVWGEYPGVRGTSD